MDERREPGGYAWETVVAQARFEPEDQWGAVVQPIYQTSVYRYDHLGEAKRFPYARRNNPNREALEQIVAQLEGGQTAVAFSSGMAAIYASLRLLRRGQVALLPDDVYGGVYDLFVRVLAPDGISFRLADLSDPGVITPEVGLVWCETPTNPRLKILDLQEICRRASDVGAWTVVDNTLATPYLQQPLALGADVVLHSSTKYLGGHSDVIGGLAVTSQPDLAAHLRTYQQVVGAVPSPLDCWLVMRGIRTLALRMRQHCASAQQVAEFLCGHPRVRRVHYPGLPSDPGHSSAKGQMRGFGGIVAFEPEGGLEAARQIASSTRLFVLTNSLGGTESIISHPASMSHRSMAGEPGSSLPDSLLRLSVGLEDAGDLIGDLQSALSGV